jgi:hypothetical protein
VPLAATAVFAASRSSAACACEYSINVAQRENSLRNADFQDQSTTITRYQRGEASCLVAIQKSSLGTKKSDNINDPGCGSRLSNSLASFMLHYSE